MYNTSNLTLSLTRLSCIPLSSLPQHTQETLFKASTGLLFHSGKLMLLNNLHFFLSPCVISVSGCSSFSSDLCFSLLALITLWRTISDASLSVCFRDTALDRKRWFSETGSWRGLFLWSLPATHSQGDHQHPLQSHRVSHPWMRTGT